ncbi:unnamed protein product [Cylicocyclus nassatus]|uniref:Uncharacterized protein n=1 Tax=Cylicocyclus nassatus TaxID=53992 RepID=A0AA36GG12_CYLNA|nr:unnamed protein product [Cylicocyclus nassatus]
MGKPTQRVLYRKGKGKGIDVTDEFSVNDNFQFKLILIMIQLVTSKGELEPKKETKSKVEDDRKSEVEAAIVRVMKSRKARSQQPHHGGDAAAKVSVLTESNFDQEENRVCVRKRLFGAECSRSQVLPLCCMFYAR